MFMESWSSMNKVVSMYILITSCLFFSTIVMNISKRQNLLYLLHPYNIILAVLTISGLILYVSIIKKNNIQ